MTSNIEIRKCIMSDEKVLAYIQTESWKNAFQNIISKEELIKYTDINENEKMYKNVLQNNIANGNILLIDKKPHCISFWAKARDFYDDSNTAEIICIHSLCDNWRKGYGTIMMNHIIDEIKKQGYDKIILWVFEKNFSARAFYEKNNFVLTDNKKEVFNATEVMYIKNL